MNKAKPQEDTKMDLSNAVVGDKYLSENNMTYTVAVVGDINLVCRGFGNKLIFFDFDGSSEDGGVLLVKKHDPRWWLSELPDAEWFELFSVDYIMFSSVGVWRAYMATGPEFILRQDRMPRPKGEEYQQSKISIKDLAEYQSKGKE